MDSRLFKKFFIDEEDQGLLFYFLREEAISATHNRSRFSEVGVSSCMHHTVQKAFKKPVPKPVMLTKYLVRNISFGYFLCLGTAQPNRVDTENHREYSRKPVGCSTETNSPKKLFRDVEIGVRKRSHK